MLTAYLSESDDEGENEDEDKERGGGERKNEREGEGGVEECAMKDRTAKQNTFYTPIGYREHILHTY